MTAVQLNALNAQIWRDMGIRKVAKEMTEDPTAMSKEEFYAMLDEREEAYARGEYSEMLPGETLTEHLRRLGHDI